MCGRFVQDISPSQLTQTYGLASAPRLPSRYNIAPSQQVAAVRPSEDGGQSLVRLRWGLIPSWAKDINVGYKMINARSETAHEKPSFRQALKSRRCVIPANGFYEWQKAGKSKIPHYIRLTENQVMSFAGLWDRWASPDGQVIESCTILTTEANDLLRPIHDRMPVILSQNDLGRWLRPGHLDAAELSDLFRPYSPATMDEYVVTMDVNSPSNDSRDNILPV